MMNLVKYNPAREMNQFRHRFNRMFEDFFPEIRGDSGEMSMWNWEPKVDVYENDDHYVIKAAVPGVKKEDLNVDMNGRVLTIKGERSEDKKVEKEKYYRKETAYGKFERSFTLPVEIDAEQIKAEYKDGVLNVKVPKSEERKPKKIAVQ